MTALLKLLEDFGDPVPEANRKHTITEVELEEVRLSAFDKGFSAGWDDALHTQNENQLRLTHQLSEFLSDTQFTYDEARSSILSSIAPLISETLNKVLPMVLHKTIGLRLAQELGNLLEQECDRPINLQVPEGTASTISQSLKTMSAEKVAVVENSALADDQFAFGPKLDEQFFDSKALVEQISTVLEQALELMQREVGHGT